MGKKKFGKCIIQSTQSVFNCLRFYKDGLYSRYALICYKIVSDVKITNVEYSIFFNAEKYE